MDKIEKVKRQYPKINIKVVCEADTNKMLELLQEHKIDFAIIDSDLDRINVVVEEILKIENICFKSSINNSRYKRNTRFKLYIKS